MTPPRRNALDPQLPSPTPSLAGGRPVTSDLSRPEWFINRELSLLEFNRRVLDLAKDQKVPLLERLKYLCIVSSNLDEFFEVRVAGLKEQVTHGAEQRGADGLTPSELLSRIAVACPASLTGHARTSLVPALYAYWERFFRTAFGEFFRCLTQECISVQNISIPLLRHRIRPEILCLHHSYRTRFLAVLEARPYRL